MIDSWYFIMSIFSKIKEAIQTIQDDISSGQAGFEEAILPRTRTIDEMIRVGSSATEEQRTVIDQLKQLIQQSGISSEKAGVTTLDSMGSLPSVGKPVSLSTVASDSLTIFVGQEGWERFGGPRHAEFSAFQSTRRNR